MASILYIDTFAAVLHYLPPTAVGIAAKSVASLSAPAVPPRSIPGGNMLIFFVLKNIPRRPPKTHMNPPKFHNCLYKPPTLHK